MIWQQRCSGRETSCDIYAACSPCWQGPGKALAQAQAALNFTLSGALRLFENSLGLLLIDQNTLIDEGPRKQAGSLSLQPAHMILL